MNTNEIQNAMLANTTTAALFRGVFACDEVQLDSYPLPAGMIINTDSSSKGGQHWVAVYQETPQTIEFFDSFGREVSYYGKCLREALNSKKIVLQQHQLQSDFSDLCGPYCMFFLYKKGQGFSFQQVLESFSSNTMFNDVMIDNFVNSHFSCVSQSMTLLFGD